MDWENMLGWLFQRSAMQPRMGTTPALGAVPTSPLQSLGTKLAPPIDPLAPVVPLNTQGLTGTRG